MRVAKTLSFLFIWLCFVSCSGNAYRIKDADRIDILFNDDAGNILKYTETSKKLINDFRKVLDSKVGKRKCSTMGEIAFYSKNKLLFEAGFSISGQECQYLMAGEKAWRLTYNTGMYLSELLADLKKASK